MFCLILSSSSILKPIIHTIIFYMDIIFVKGYILYYETVLIIASVRSMEQRRFEQSLMCAR